MARFFFHVTNGSTFKDAEGENCSSLEAARTHAAKIAGELGKDRGYEPMNGINAPQRPDCVSGHVRLELRNVVANYPFERSHRFPEIQPKFWPRRLFTFELRRWRYAARA